ncbi:MAG: prephenate dehydratase [Planctomycetota bacterium]
MADDKLDALRKRIDDLDAEIVKLINDRAQCARDIGELKRSKGTGAFAPARERAVYERVLALNKGPLPAESIKAIYREIMSGSLALERCPRVAYLGPAGTFTHKAARSKFGSSVEYHPEPSVRDVFLEVSRGHSDYGVVPIENSTEGGVNQTIDCFFETQLKVCSEIYVAVHHNLMANCNREGVRVIYSHPQVFGQCREYIGANFPKVQQVECSSTTAAAERAGKEPGAAAIASDTAAEIYGLNVLEPAIEDNPDNVTRFFVISREAAPQTGNDKTSIMVSIKDAPGVLHTLLRTFSEHGINLTRIESRPSKKKAWDYYFFIDLLGHVEDGEVAGALDSLDASTRRLEVLGSYPRAEHVPMPEHTGTED